jgi:vacuolar-type H+-ATPase subunit I/STV1
MNKMFSSLFSRIEEVKKMNESKMVSTDESKMKAKLEDVINENKILSDYVSKVNDNVNLLVEQINKLNSKNDNTITEIGNKLNEVISNVNNNYNKTDLYLEKYVSNIGNKLNEVIHTLNNDSDVNEIGNKLNEVIHTLNNDSNSDVSDIGNKLNEVIHTLNNDSNVNENVIEYIESMSNKMNQIIKSINESKKTEKTDKYEIFDKIDEALQKKNNVKINDVDTNKYPFLLNANSDTVKVFNNINESNKKNVSRMLNNKTNITDEVILESIEKSKKSDTVINIMYQTMPKKYTESWDKMSKKDKNAIISLFRIKNTSDSVIAESIWDSIDMNNNIRIDESFDGNDENDENGAELGYSIDEINNSF